MFKVNVIVKKNNKIPKKRKKIPEIFVSAIFFQYGLRPTYPANSVVAYPEIFEYGLQSGNI